MPDRHVVVLVEGASDAAVVELLADGAGPGLEVVAMGGVTNVAHHVRRLADRSPPPVVLGLCDARERRFLERADPPLDAILVCDRDLEEELIRAVGPEQVLAVLEELSDLDRFRTFQGQPEWRDRPLADQLRRFAGRRPPPAGGLLRNEVRLHAGGEAGRRVDRGHEPRRGAAAGGRSGRRRDH